MVASGGGVLHLLLKHASHTQHDITIIYPGDCQTAHGWTFPITRLKIPASLRKLIILSGVVGEQNGYRASLFP